MPGGQHTGGLHTGELAIEGCVRRMAVAVFEWDSLGCLECCDSQTRCWTRQWEGAVVMGV